MNKYLLPAIRCKRRLKLRYPGHEHLVEPHAYGLDRCGIPVLLCYELAIDGTPGSAEGWRELDLRGALRIFETREYFRDARPGYHPGRTGLRAIFAQV